MDGDEIDLAAVALAKELLEIVEAHPMALTVPVPIGDRRRRDERVGVLPEGFDPLAVCRNRSSNVLHAGATVSVVKECQ